MGNTDFKVTKIEKMSLYDAKTNNKIIEFNINKPELTKELHNKDNFSFNPETCKALSVIAKRMKNIENLEGED